jgi:hypothetical protein
VYRVCVCVSVYVYVDVCDHVSLACRDGMGVGRLGSAYLDGGGGGALVAFHMSILGVHVPGTLESGTGHEDNNEGTNGLLRAGEGGRHGKSLSGVDCGLGVGCCVWCVCVCVCVE